MRDLLRAIPDDDWVRPRALLAHHGDVCDRLAFLLIRPDAVHRGLTMGILDRLADAGLRPIDAMAIAPHTLQLEELYRYTQVRMMSAGNWPLWWYTPRYYRLGPAVVVLLAGEPEADPAAVRLVEMKGPSNPGLARPGQIRYDFGSQNMVMCSIHSSDVTETMLREAAIFFPSPRLESALERLSSDDADTVDVRGLLSDNRLAVEPVERANFHQTLARLQRDILLRLAEREPDRFGAAVAVLAARLEVSCGHELTCLAYADRTRSLANVWSSPIGSHVLRALTGADDELRFLEWSVRLEGTGRALMDEVLDKLTLFGHAFDAWDRIVLETGFGFHNMITEEFRPTTDDGDLAKADLGAAPPVSANGRSIVSAAVSVPAGFRGTSSSGLPILALSTLDPLAPLDDLEPLREAIGSARVVAIGESAHNIREYHLLRHRLTRFLVERLGFTSVALESGFSEGLAVDRWIHEGTAETAEVAESGLNYRFGQCAEMRDMLDWMRSVNEGGGDLTYTGLDLPGELASMLPALDSIGRYLGRVDGSAVDLLAGVRAQAIKYAGPHTMPAFAAYQAMDSADRDRLTLALAELAARFDTLRPLYLESGTRRDYETARHELRLAGLLDQMLRAQFAAARGSAAHAGLNVRDAALAETATWLLRQSTERLVIGAANTHVQRRPLRIGGRLELPVLGSYLAAELGDEYLSIGVTCGGGRTSSRRAAPSAPGGVETIIVELEPPSDGSIEALLGSDSTGPHLADVRPLRGEETGPCRIRSLESYVDVTVADAFDLVASVPSVETTAQAGSG